MWLKKLALFFAHMVCILCAWKQQERPLPAIITYGVPFPYCCMYLCVPAASDEFTSFPLSAQLKGILATEQHERQKFSLSVFAMRLAAQETRQRWYSYDI